MSREWGQTAGSIKMGLVIIEQGGIRIARHEMKIREYGKR